MTHEHIHQRYDVREDELKRLFLEDQIDLVAFDSALRELVAAEQDELAALPEGES